MKKKSILVGLLFATGALAITTTTACTSDNTPATEESTYTITFDAQNGSTNTTASTNNSGKVTQPVAPTKEGYTFDGWYDNAACTGTAIDFANKTFTANTTLYAKWVEAAHEYTITFNSVEGSSVGSATTTAGKITKPANPTKENMVFAGWYTSSDYAAKFDFDSAVTADTTLYAKWVETISYTDFHAELKAGDYAAIEGYIAARQTYYKGAAIYIYAGEGQGFFGYSIPMTEDEYNTKYTVGTYVRLSGEVAEYAGELEISGSGSTIETKLEVVEGKPEFTPVAVDLTAKMTELENYKDAYFTGTWKVKSCANLASDSKVVANNGAYYTESGAQYIILTDGTTDMTVGINKYFENRADIVSMLNVINVDDNVTVTGYMYWWNGPNAHIASIELGGVVAYFHNVDNEGTITATKLIKEDGEYMVTDPNLSTTEYAEFNGWYTDETYETAFDFNNPVEDTVHLYAKWTEKTEFVTYKFEASKLTDGTVDDDMAVGAFIVGAGSEVRAESSKKLNGVDYGRGVKLQGTAKFSFVAAGAGSAKLYVVDRGSLTKVTLTKPDGTTQELTYTVSTTDSKQMGIISFDMETKGTYSISIGSGTPDIAYAEMRVEVGKAPTTGISCSNAQTAFLKGRQFQTGNIDVILNYKNGRQDILDNTQYSVDDSQVDTSKAGTYEVVVQYGDYTTTYNVDVYEIEEVVLYDYTITPGKYTTNNLAKVFIKGSTFNSTYLTVHATCVTPNKTDKMDFILAENEYQVSTVDTTTVGAQTVTVTCADSKTGTYTVNVVENVFAATATEVTVSVDPSKDVVATSEAVNFKTIVDALTYLKACNLSDECEKIIQIAPGTYEEKIAVTLPNVSFRGMGENYDAVVIEFGALNALADPSGKATYSTVGSATVHIASTAYGFSADKITFKNKYNTHELYLASQKIAPAGTQADALYCEADMSVFTNCKFTSYHDTLEAEKGRQIYDHCFIEGRTDFIFGNNATVLFNECEIKVLGNSKSADKNGGYIFCNKGVAGQEFVYVVNKCKIYGDENVQPGTVSLGRTWATDMKLVVMNCELSNIISKETYKQVSEDSEIGDKNDRYTQMSASATIKPANMVEYNNTGDGAIAATDTDLITAMATATCTVKTEVGNLINAASDTYAQDYREFVLKMFGAENGETKNNFAWGGLYALDAKVNLVANGETIATLDGYAGSTITEKQLKDAVEAPSGYKLDGFYADENCTQEYDVATLLDATHTIYVKFVKLGAIQAITSFDGTKDKDNAGWTLAEGASYNGTTKLGAIGTVAGSGVDCLKIDTANKSTAILSNVFKPAKSVELTIVAASTATSSAVKAKFELLDADGAVVKTIQEEICKDKLVTQTELKLESEVDFVQIRLSSVDKNFAIKSIEGVANLAYKDNVVISNFLITKETIKENRVYDNTFSVNLGTYTQYNIKDGTGLSFFHGNEIKFTVSTNGATLALGLTGATTARYVVLKKGETEIKKYLTTDNGVGAEGTYLELTASKGWLKFENLEAGEWTITCDTDEDKKSGGVGNAEIKCAYIVLVDKVSTRI